MCKIKYLILCFDNVRQINKRFYQQNSNRN